MLNKILLFALILIIAGNILSWFQLNLQFISDWWRDRPMITVVLFSTPAGAFFYYGWRFLVEYFEGNLWPPRLFSFGIGIIIFSTLAYMVKGEVLDKKTIACLFLSIIIILIQTLPPKTFSLNKIKDSLSQHNEE